MTNESEITRSVYKYNMSFYYQATIIYLVVFILYLVIRGEFVEGSFMLLTKDPILYFLALIVVISVISVLYNLFRNKHIELSENGIKVFDRFKKRSFDINQIKTVRFTKQRRMINSKAFKLIRIKVDSRIRPLVIRPSDYENQDELIERFEQLKQLIEKN
jgi:hypothetical protein